MNKITHREGLSIFPEAIKNSFSSYGRVFGSIGFLIMILTGINFFVQYDLFHHPDKRLAIFENITIICITIFNASMGLSCYYMAAGQLLRRREITISGFMEIFTDGSYLKKTPTPCIKSVGALCFLQLQLLNRY